MPKIAVFVSLLLVYTNVCCTISDIKECSDTSNPPCDENAKCIEEDGGFRCECFPGYEGPGTTCKGEEKFWWPFPVPVFRRHYITTVHHMYTEIILGTGSTNEGLRYNITSSLIDCAHIQMIPGICTIRASLCFVVNRKWWSLLGLLA